MSLMSKLRAPALAVMLGAAALGASNGCTTITPWRTIGTEQKQIGVERTVTENAGIKTFSTRTLNISDVYLEDEEYKTKITESMKRDIYGLKEEKSIMRVQDIKVEQKEKQTEILGPIFLGTCAVGGTVAGVKLGGDLAEDMPTLGKILGGLAGALVGTFIGAGVGRFAPVSRKIETRRQEGIARDVVSSRGVKEIFVRQDLVYKNQPGVNAKFGIEGKSQTYQANARGIIDWEEDNPYAFVSRESLEKRLEEFPLVQEIKPETRKLLRENLLRSITHYSKRFTIETREKPINPNLEKVENCKRDLKLDYYTLTDENIYRIVKAFVDENINSKIKTLSFNVMEDLSHTPISGTVFDFQTDAPKKSELAERYFTGELKGYAEEKIRDYIIGSFTAESCPESIDFMVYSPSNIFLEITHPDYNFVDGEIEINSKGVAINGDLQKVVNGKTQIPVYMADKGSKVRVEKAGESKGKIGK